MSPSSATSPSGVGIFLRTVVLVQVFAGLAAAAYYFLWVQQTDSGLWLVFERNCPAEPGSSAPSRLPYTGVAAIDSIACILVTFFTPAINPPLRNGNIDLLVALGVVYFPILLDSASLFSGSRITSILVPLIAGLATQLKGGGFVFPIYWLFSLLGRTGTRAAGVPPPRPDATAVQAALFAIVVAYLPPTGLMFARTSPYTIAAWQPFPVYVALAQALWYLLFSKPPAIPRRETGKAPNAANYLLIQASFLILACISTFGHIPFAYDILTSDSPLAAVRDALVPYPHAFSYASSEEIYKVAMFNEAKRFLQWDTLFIGASCWLAGAWSWAFNDFKTFAAAVISSLTALATLGPGLFIATPFMIKELVDERRRGDRAVKPESAKK